MHTGQHERENQRVVYLFSVKHGDYSSQPYFHQDPKTICYFVTSLLCKWPSHITIKHLLLENNTKLHHKGPGYCELKMSYLISLKCNDCHVAKHFIGERARFPRSWFIGRYEIVDLSSGADAALRGWVRWSPPVCRSCQESDGIYSTK